MFFIISLKTFTNLYPTYDPNSWEYEIHVIIPKISFAWQQHKDVLQKMALLEEFCISVAHFSCLKFFAKNEKNEAIFREKRKIHEKYFFTVFLWNYAEEKY